MIDSKIFYDCLKENGVEYFCGVPDSLLKSFCAYITDNTSKVNHVITANEGAAVGLASGWFLGTGKPALVYMQNSGIGNAVNPLLSLADPDVYGIPMLLLIGWRGEPGIKDEPQHKKQGKVTLSLLEAMDISYTVIDDKTENFEEIIEKAVKKTREDERPFAIVARKNTFSPYTLRNSEDEKNSLSREKAVITASELAAEDSVIVSTTGMISRELFEYRERKKISHDSDFLTVGSMGHCSQIAFGLAAARPEKRVYCFDGDGSVIMHMGSMGINGIKAPENLVHIVFNNGAHDSVGGQETIGFDIDFPAVAEGCRYRKVYKAATEKEISCAFNAFKNEKGPVFLEILVKKGARGDLGRPTVTTQDQKKNFMDLILNKTGSSK